MIVRPRPKLWELFRIWRLSIVPRIAPQILLVATVAAGVVLLWRQSPHFFLGFNVAPFTLLGIALSLPVRDVLR